MLIPFYSLYKYPFIALSMLDNLPPNPFKNKLILVRKEGRVMVGKAIIPVAKYAPTILNILKTFSQV
jgi:hypothetical protein